MKNMKYSFIYTLFFLIISMASCFSDGEKETDTMNHDKHPANTITDITWQAAMTEKDTTVIPGSLYADFGRFEFRWVIDVKGKASLSTLKPAGSGELPPLEQRILPLVLSSGKTMLFEEWFPLLNAQKPATLKRIATVDTKSLFAVLPAGSVPPLTPDIPPASLVRWEAVQTGAKGKFIQGSLSASFGTLNVLWQKSAGQVAKLVTIEAPGAGELPPVAVPLFYWNDETTNTSLILRERHPLLNQKHVSTLWILATVKTDELLAGFNRVN